MAERRTPGRSDAEGFGVSATELRRWHPLSAFEVHLLRRAGASETVRYWIRLGATVTDALRAERRGLTPDEVRPWLGDGFCAQDAVDAHEAGISLEVARAWREAGFILPDALLLLRDGWTLAAATAQRYVDVAEPVTGFSDGTARRGTGRGTRAGRRASPGEPPQPESAHNPG